MRSDCHLLRQTYGGNRVTTSHGPHFTYVLVYIFFKHSGVCVCVCVWGGGGGLLVL